MHGDHRLRQPTLLADLLDLKDIDQIIDFFLDSFQSYQRIQLIQQFVGGLLRLALFRRLFLSLDRRLYSRRCLRS